MTTATPIMSPDEERFIAFEGLVQWAHDVVEQSNRISNALDQKRNLYSPRVGRVDPVESRKRLYAIHSACYHFVTAAYKLLECRDRAVEYGLCSEVDFSDIDRFSKADIRDLRDMREHTVEYFQGKGHSPTRWMIVTPEYKADASTLAGSISASSRAIRCGTRSPACTEMDIA